MGVNGTKAAAASIGAYDLLEIIGEGGMSTVYKGRQRQTGRLVAVKVLAPAVAENKVGLRRFEKEARVCRELDHPNIIRALDYGVADGSPYLVMEFVEGESLGQRIERDGPLPEAEAVGLITQAAAALAYAHQRGLVHRDVKPDNLLVTPDGQVKVADLGLVKEAETPTDINLTRDGMGLGTPHFMAPEQFRNARSADVRCDVYSLAATLYMMVTGELPFSALSPVDTLMKKLRNELTSARSLVPSLSERLSAALRRALDAEPQCRPPSCQEFIAELTNTAADVWYVAYKGPDGVARTVRGSQAGIRRQLNEGRLGDPSVVRASQSKKGPFRPLLHYSEFQDGIDSPTAPDRAREAAPPPIDDGPEGSNFRDAGQEHAVAARESRLKPKRGKDPLRAAEAPSVKRKKPRTSPEPNATPAVERLKVCLMVFAAMTLGFVVFMLFRR